LPYSIAKDEQLRRHEMQSPRSTS